MENENEEVFQEEYSDEEYPEYQVNWLGTWDELTRYL